MSRFQVWDVPSATILDETDDLHEIADTAQSLIDEIGLIVLDDLALIETPGETGQRVSHTGRDVMLSIQRRMVKNRSTSAR